MKIISKSSWEEYKQLKHNALMQANFDSVRSLNLLENDIDTPIKKIVAMLALLRCDPKFSCCGFDYDGQPLHKSHEYGCCYIQMVSNEYNREITKTLTCEGVFQSLTKKSPKWEWWEERDRLFWRAAFTLYHPKEYPWISRNDCIHYSEIAVLCLDILERKLLRLRNYFQDEWVLYDTNHAQKNYNLNWQYPALEPWVIKKEDYANSK